MRGERSTHAERTSVPVHPRQARESTLHQQLTILLAGWLALAVAPATAQVTALDRDAQYPEGPLWRDGKLLYVEYSTGNVKIRAGASTSVIWHKDGCGPSGLIPRGANLLVACYDDNSLVELNAANLEIRVLRTDSKGKPLVGPNDFAADDEGGIYFSASGAYDVKAPATGALLYLRPDGKTITEVATGLHYPNGLTLMKDRRHLLVAEMLKGRLVSFQIDLEGTLSERKIWARLQDLAPPTPDADAYNGPDGTKLGPDGNYYIAQNGSGRVLVVNDDKQLVRTITVPTRYVTNVAFAKNVVFITGVFDQWRQPYPGGVYESRARRQLPVESKR